MGRQRSWRPKGEAPLAISERDGVRALHLGSERVQSAMRLGEPLGLELDYTRAMMGFLLFHPQPRRVLMVGLGGGSLAKFVHARLPALSTVAVEILPEVVAAARGHFFLPPDDERLTVVVGDGGEYVARHPACCEVLMVDGFEDGERPAALSSQAFYDAAWDALDGSGVLVVNFLSRDGEFDGCLQRIEASFEGHVACLQPEPPGNVIVFALKGLPARWRWDRLRERARALERELGLPFSRFVSGLGRLNRYSARGLEI